MNQVGQCETHWFMNTAESKLCLWRTEWVKVTHSRGYSFLLTLVENFGICICPWPAIFPMDSGEGSYSSSLYFLKASPPLTLPLFFFPFDSGNPAQSFSSCGVYIPKIEDLQVKRQKASKFSPRGFGRVFFYYQKPQALPFKISLCVY